MVAAIDGCLVAERRRRLQGCEELLRVWEGAPWRALSVADLPTERNRALRPAFGSPEPDVAQATLVPEPAPVAPPTPPARRPRRSEGQPLAVMVACGVLLVALLTGAAIGAAVASLTP
jgi:hypothetical protein